jgi:hypothetical protein
MVPTITRWKMRVGALWVFLGSCFDFTIRHLLPQKYILSYEPATSREPAAYHEYLASSYENMLVHP